MTEPCARLRQTKGVNTVPTEPIIIIIDGLVAVLAYLLS